MDELLENFGLLPRGMLGINGRVVRKELLWLVNMLDGPFSDRGKRRWHVARLECWFRADAEGRDLGAGNGV